jgi:hypothetical protein
MLLRETKAKNENALMTLAMRPVREGEKATGEINAVVVVAVREENNGEKSRELTALLISK